MISETFFSSHYTSLWRSIAPSMEEFVRRTNLDGVDRFWTPIDSAVASDRRGLVNEAAFLLFVQAVGSRPQPAKTWFDKHVGRALEAAEIYISGERGSEEHQNPDEVERNESIVLCERLMQYFMAPRLGKLVLQPQFSGCGILSACNGDVVSEVLGLFEVKSGNRPFRSTDYRQLSVYLSLQYAETRFLFPNLHLVNPRTGLVASLATEDFTMAVSGKSAAAYCQSVIECFSANLISE